MARGHNVEGIASRVLTLSSTVATQGPDIPVPDDKSVVIRGSRGNTGTVGVADNATDADPTGTNVFTLAAGEAVAYDVFNVNRLFFQSSVNAETVDITVEFTSAR